MGQNGSFESIGSMNNFGGISHQGSVESLEHYDVDVYFEMSSDGEEDVLFDDEDDPMNNIVEIDDPEDLRMIIKDLRENEKKMKEKNREETNALKMRIVELERENRKMSARSNIHSQEKIKRLEEELKMLVQKAQDKHDPGNPGRVELEEEINRAKLEHIDGFRFRSKRNNIIKEFFMNERSYVESLKLLKTQYLSVLSKGKIIAKKNYDKIKIFEDFEMIYKINCEFLASLEEKVLFSMCRVDDREEALFDLVIQFCDSFKFYSYYIQHCSESQKIINELVIKKKKLRNFLDDTSSRLWTENEESVSGGTKDYSLSGFLIEPINRLPRYLLFLKSLHKNSRKGSDSYRKLNDAMETLKDTIDFCDESSNKYQMALELVKLADLLDISLLGKELLLKKKLERVTHTEGTKPCILYLLNDMLVIRDYTPKMKRKRMDSFISRGKRVLANQWTVRFLEKDWRVHGFLRVVHISDYRQPGSEGKKMLTLEVRGYLSALKIVVDNMKVLMEVVSRINSQGGSIPLQTRFDRSLKVEEEEEEGED